MPNRVCSPRYRYLIYLDNNTHHYGNDSKLIIQKIRATLQNYPQNEIRDLRISSYFLELDVGSDVMLCQPDDEDGFIEILEGFGKLLKIEEVSEHGCDVLMQESISTAVLLFNMERFWKSHEVLEQVWKEASGLPKSILNGVILVDAAFVHLQKGEQDIYFSILRRSLQKFLDSPQYFYGVSICELVGQVKFILSSNKAAYFKIKIN